MPTPLLQDTFVDTNGTALSAHAPQFPVGASFWTTLPSQTDLVIQSNQAQALGANQANYYTIGSQPNYQMDCDVILAGSTSSDLAEIAVNSNTTLSSGINLILRTNLVSLLSAQRTQITLVPVGGSNQVTVALYNCISDNLYHHITATWDGLVYRLWVDGALLITSPNWGAIPQTGGNVVIRASVTATGAAFKNLRVTTLPTGVQSTSYWPGPLG